MQMVFNINTAINITVGSVNIENYIIVITFNIITAATFTIIPL